MSPSTLNRTCRSRLSSLYRDSGLVRTEIAIGKLRLRVVHRAPRDNSLSSTTAPSRWKPRYGYRYLLPVIVNFPLTRSHKSYHESQKNTSTKSESRSPPASSESLPVTECSSSESEPLSGYPGRNSYFAHWQRRGWVSGWHRILVPGVLL
eukprot:1265576-Rhodomonas_salina.1